MKISLLVNSASAECGGKIAEVCGDAKKNQAPRNAAVVIGEHHEQAARVVCPNEEGENLIVCEKCKGQSQALCSPSANKIVKVRFHCQTRKNARLTHSNF